MNYFRKIISIRELITEETTSLPKLHDRFENGLLKQSVQFQMRERYGLYKKLFEMENERGGLTRYDHTNILAESYFQLLDNDYESFLRLHPRKLSQGEHLMTREQFDWVRNIAIRISQSEQDRHLFFMLSITHDYGTLYGDPKHFIKSGEICDEDFIKDGYSKDIETIKIIVGNHSYFGDLFLGEGSHEYGFDMLARVENAGFDLNRFWDLLVLLNIVDINSHSVDLSDRSKGGFLSKEKVESFQKVGTIEDFKIYQNDWPEDRFSYFGRPEGYLSKYQDQLPKNLNQIYMQYFMNMGVKLSDTELIDCFNTMGKLFDLRESGQLDHFNYITFAKDNEKGLENLKTIIDIKNPIELTDSRSGTIAGYYFEITDDGYLTIMND